jgi:hypothetical protein
MMSKTSKGNLHDSLFRGLRRNMSGAGLNLQPSRAGYSRENHRSVEGCVLVRSLGDGGILFVRASMGFGGDHAFTMVKGKRCSLRKDSSVA